MNQMMLGTASPEQMAQQQQQQMIADALRALPQQQRAPQQAGNVVSASGGAEAFDPTAIGGALRGVGGNVGTAMQYGTNPFSQQTNMLQAQTAGM